MVMQPGTRRCRRNARGAGAKVSTARTLYRGAGTTLSLVAAIVLPLAACGSARTDGDAQETQVSGPDRVEEDAVEGDATSPSADDQADGELGWSVVEVIDGDTLVVSRSGIESKVRLIGINTPESGECFADKATDALANLVDGGTIHLVADESDVDRYGRLLRYVEVGSGVDVGAALVANGYGIARRYEPDVARDSTYGELQAVAQAEQLGLWAPDACGRRLVDGDVVRVEVNADARGDDNENLNGEWVRFTNVTTSPLDLDGWEIADESASHRFLFDEVVLMPGGAVTIYTGCGDRTETELYWCSQGSAVWNNAGDTVFLRDPNGNLVAVYAYE
jgi:micrococcal nuclease